MVTTMASVQLAHRHYHPPHHFPLIRPVSPADQIMTLDCSQASTSQSSEADARSISPKELSPPPSPSGSEGRDPQNSSETPLRKNKRKLSEPKRRSDAIVSRDSPKTIIQESNSAVENRDKDTEEISNAKKSKSKKLTNGRSKKSFSWSAAQLPGNRQQSSSTSSSENEGSREHEVPPPPPFLPTSFHGSPSAALGFLPGLFFPGTPYPHPALNPSFSALPLHLQHTYLAAASSAQASSTAPASASTSGTSAGVEPNSDRAHHSKSALNPTTRHPSLSLANAFQPSSVQRASSSKTSASIHEEEDDASSSRAQSPEDLSFSGKMSRKHRKNYKNMTRERRVEANARERTRVHTISAAFDALRHAVPSYSHNQKLSKLAILRIACSYIMSLARLADLDYTSASEHIGTPLTFAECVDMCTNTIQTEGRARRRH